MRNKSLFTMFMVLLLAFTTIESMHSSSVFANPGTPKVFVDPQINTAAPGETFSININVSEITTIDSLYGWEFTLRFNSSVLNVTQVTRGAFLGDNTMWAWGMIEPLINNTEGFVTAGDALLDFSPGAGKSGNGTLAKITFLVKAEGRSPLRFDYTDLYTVKPPYPPGTIKPIYHVSVDGCFKYPPGPILYDIAVTSVTASPNMVLIGGRVNINATIENEGDLRETFNVIVYYDSAILDNKTVTLAAGLKKNLTFTWDTTGVALGIYTIKAEVPPITGETDTSDNTFTDGLVKLIAPPTASFTFTPDFPIVGETVTFNASASTPNGGTIKSYTWDFGDTNITTVTYTLITHIYATAGTYTVILNVTDSEGLWDTHSKIISIGKQASTITISASPSKMKLGESTTISGIINPTKVSVDVTIRYRKIGTQTWDILATVATNSTSQYSYIWTPTAYGTFELKSSWLGDANTSPAESKAVSLTITKLPTASFTYEPTSPIVNDIVTFNASASVPDGGTIQSYTWNFGDGTSDTGMIVTHVYTTSGVRNVTLTVTDSEGLSHTSWQLITIRQNPIALFTFDPEEPLATQTVIFNASSSRDPDGTVITYAWNFGDGSTGNGKIVEHAYAKAGTYTVTLTLTDNDGLTDIATTDIQVFVHDIAITNVVASPNTVQIGELVSISVVVANNGNFSQTFNITVYYDSTPTDAKTVNLAAGKSKTETFTWNTTGIAAGAYIIKAQASPVPEETDQTNNTFNDGTVTLKTPETPPQPPPNVFLYALAGVILFIMAVGIAIFFLKTRKTT